MRTTKTAVTSALTLAGLLTLPAGALAEQVTFIHSGLSGSGTLNGVAFTDAAFVFTATADTANIVDLGGGTFYLDHDTANVEIFGVGTFDFITGTRTFAAADIMVGFSREGPAGLDLFNASANAAFAGYNLSTSIGPIVGDGSLVQWDSPPLMETTGGTLFFNTNTTTATFTAIVVPAPAGAAGLLLGLAAAARRRR